MKYGSISLLAVLLALFTTQKSNAQIVSLWNEDGTPDETLIEALLSPGEFPHRRFIHISEGDEAQYCLDSSLSSAPPFAQVYPERISWPNIGGVPLIIETLDLKLIPKGDWVTDDILDKGFAIRWQLQPVGQTFSAAPAFKMQAVGAEVFSVADGRILMHWSKPEKPPVCKDKKSNNEPQCDHFGISREVQGLAISPNGKLVAIATTGIKPRIELYDITAEPSLSWQGLFPPSSGGVLDVSFSADGRYVAALLGNGKIHRFDALSGGDHLAIPSKGRSAQSVPPGITIAVAGDNGEVTLWRLNDGTIEWRLPPRQLRGPVDKLAVSGDGRKIATLEYEVDKTVVRIWERNRRSMIAQVEVDENYVADLALDEQGHRLYVSHEKRGLLAAPIKKGHTTLTPVGNSTKQCTGSIKWINQSGMLSCSVDGGILWVTEEGTPYRMLKTQIPANDWLVAASSGGLTTAAVGAGHLLIWWK